MAACLGACSAGRYTNDIVDLSGNRMEGCGAAFGGVDFPDVFGEQVEDGFDLIIGNPPGINRGRCGGHGSTWR